MPSTAIVFHLYSRVRLNMHDYQYQSRKFHLFVLCFTQCFSIITVNSRTAAHDAADRDANVRNARGEERSGASTN